MATNDQGGTIQLGSSDTHPIARPLAGLAHSLRHQGRNYQVVTGLPSSGREARGPLSGFSVGHGPERDNTAVRGSPFRAEATRRSLAQAGHCGGDVGGHDARNTCETSRSPFAADAGVVASQVACQQAQAPFASYPDSDYAAAFCQQGGERASGCCRQAGVGG